MFTGIIEDVGRVERIDPLPSGRGLRLRLAARLLDDVAPLGSSLAVDGVCLTIVAASRGHAQADVGPETVERTTLGQLRAGQSVNLERPLKLGDRLGGHLVAGHVDGVGTITAVAPRGEAVDLTIAAGAPLLRYVIEKGSITVDGISLTVNRVDEKSFSVSLIPHTQDVTTLPKKTASAQVNLEVDLIGKYVEKLLGGRVGAAGLTWSKLVENGFASE